MLRFFLPTCFHHMSDHATSIRRASLIPHVDACLVLTIYTFLPPLLHALTMPFPHTYNESFIYINCSLVACTLVYSLFDTQSKEPIEDF